MTVASPLRLVKPELKPKYAADLDQIISGTAERNTRNFYREFYCLAPRHAALEAAFLSTKDEDMVTGQLKENLHDLFAFGVEILAFPDHKDTRKHHVAETLLLLLARILPTLSTRDALNVLAGSLEQSDPLLSSFVAALDDILRAADAPEILKRSTLTLCLVTTSLVGQESPNSYFLRRDFFASVSKLLLTDMQDVADQMLAFIGNLANYHKFEGRNLCLKRLEDLVDDNIMRSILNTVHQAVETCREEYIAISDDGQASFTTSLTSMFASINITDALRSSVKSTSNGLESEFADQPAPESCLVFLTFYDLLHVNPAFNAMLLDQSSLSFLGSLLSYFSYTFCHASVSPRARLYAKLHLICLALILQDSEAAAKALGSPDSAAPVRLCRQRNPPLPYRSEARPLLCTVLDCLLVFLRHNMSRKLEVDSYIVAVQLIRRIMHGLKTAKARLDYQWAQIWSALFSLSSLLANKFDSMSSLPRIHELVVELLIVLDFAAFWSDLLFATADDFSLFFYEILRNEAILDKLSELTNASETNETPRSRLGPSGRAAESARNLRAIVAHFSSRLDEFKEASSQTDREPEIEDVMAIVTYSSERLDLVESAALEQFKPYLESEFELALSELYKYASQDALELVHVKG